MNREAYNKIAAQWDATRRCFYGLEEAYLDRLLDGLPRNSLILDAGCGTGLPFAGRVIERGHRILGVDQSDALLALARQRFPSQTWVLSALEDHAFAEPCQGVICWDTLFHIDRERHAELLGRMADCLPTGGRIMLTVGGSEQPAFTDTMFGVSFRYDSNTPEQTEHLLQGLGLRICAGEFMNLPTKGRDKGRYAILAQKS